MTKTLALLAVVLLAGCGTVDTTAVTTANKVQLQEFEGLADAFWAVAGTVQDDAKRQILQDRINQARGHFRAVNGGQDAALRALGTVDYQTLYLQLEATYLQSRGMPVPPPQPRNQ